ncbi:unnamed protein product [Prunus armeniaca]|uniref:Uncharacterized protein n=1 Tax=Prunus armeniaca TaxID=36596 RepID=A0A6J5TZM0_PRUAR|nr:unnamed protein product [Prunus armeniaca]
MRGCCRKSRAKTYGCWGQQWAELEGADAVIGFSGAGNRPKGSMSSSTVVGGRATCEVLNGKYISLNITLRET